MKGAHIGWNVYLGGRRIEKVFFVEGITAEQVKRSLVEHDGFDPSIVVRRESRSNPLSFSKWIDTLIEEKGIDLEDTFEFNDSSGQFNLMPYGSVVEHMKIAPAHEQKAIKTMLVRLDFMNKDIKDYLRHLGKGLAEMRLRRGNPLNEKEVRSIIDSARSYHLAAKKTLKKGQIKSAAFWMGKAEGWNDAIWQFGRTAKLRAMGTRRAKKFDPMMRTYFRNPSMYSKERREHPSFSPRQIRRIVSDHKARGRSNPEEFKEHMLYRIAYNADNEKLRGKPVTFLGWTKDPMGGRRARVALLLKDGSSGEQYLVSPSILISLYKNPLFLDYVERKSGRRLVTGHYFPRAKSAEKFAEGVAKVEKMLETPIHRATIFSKSKGTLHINPPQGKLIGRSVLSISTTGGEVRPKGIAPLYGLKDGSVFIRGFFLKVPRGNVTRIEYLDEGKAKREGLKNPSLPWRHDFTRERRPLRKVRGGLLIPRGKRPLWGAR